VCTSYIPVGSENNSNMAVMEVNFPSGFTADLDTLPSIQATKKVKVFQCLLIGKFNSG